MRGLAFVLVAACGGSAGESADPPGELADSPPATTPDGPQVDGAAIDGDYHTTLHSCWTDATCPRVFALAHGGSWDPASVPYDSNAALAAAYAAGDEAVKIDVRVTKDNVPVIAHSSPIELFESLDCANKKIEDMTAAQVTQCHRLPSTTEKFQRLDDVLDDLRGKMLVQLCVKRSEDFARTIAEIHAKDAAEFAFVEIDAGEVGLIPGLAAPDIYFLVNVADDLSAIAPILALHDPRLFMIEIDPDVAIGDLVATQLHPAGVRAFTYDSAASPSASQLEAHYAAGYDVVSSQSGPRGVEARKAANTARGVTPP